METENTFTAFAGTSLIASGDLKTMLLETKRVLDAGESRLLLIFEDQTGKQVDFDLIGTPQQVLDKLKSHPLVATPSSETQAASGPGRPKLGVVSREISLLPRHWEWLEQQSGGASAALRKLVEEARKREPGKGLGRKAREAAARFMTVMAGDLPDFEEASRALYAKDRPRLEGLVSGWPTDVRAQLLRMLDRAEQLEHPIESQEVGKI